MGTTATDPDGRGRNETDNGADSTHGGGGAYLAVLWFGGSLLVGAIVISWLVVSLAPLGCPSGAPDCAPGHTVLPLFGSVAGMTAAFTVLVLGLRRLSRRWRAAGFAFALLGLVLLLIPMLALGRAVLVGDAWLVFGLAAVWLAVPALAILADARAMLRRPSHWRKLDHGRSEFGA